jgi:hypothetical protein
VNWGDDAYADMARWKWQADHFAQRDREIAEREAQAERDRLAEYLDPNSEVVRQARAEAEALRASRSRNRRPISPMRTGNTART